METAQVPFLRKDQVDDMKGEVTTAETQLRNPNYQGDKGEVADRLRSLKKQLDAQMPRPYVGAEMDKAVARERELRAEWTQGMLSQEEMRKCPPGAVDRHRAWEKRNSARIEEWQNIQRRLNADNEDLESASIEVYRPTSSTMNMDGALIPGKTIFLPPAGSGVPVTFSNDQIAVLRALNPGLADMIGSLNNQQRAEVKEALVEKPKRTLSPEHKAKMLAGAIAAREAKKAA